MRKKTKNKRIAQLRMSPLMTFRRKDLKHIVLAMVVVTLSLAMTIIGAESKRNTFKINDQPLLDNKKMTYICVRGRVKDPLIKEKYSRGYNVGISIEGAIVWLKRNPQLRAITDDNGIFEIVCENGVLSSGIRGEDDIVCVWKPGYEYQEQCILRKTQQGIFKRDSIIRISDYDSTRYFNLKRTKNWDKYYNINAIVNSFDKYPAEFVPAVKVDYKKLNKLIQLHSIPQKAFPVSYSLQDGRVVTEIKLNGIITNSETNKPVQYAGVWLKRNPTVLTLTDEKGHYNINLNAVGLRPRTDELTDSLCVSAGMYQSKEIPLTKYKDSVSFQITQYSNIKNSGDFIKMVQIPKTFFRMGLGVTQGGGGARDCPGAEFSCTQDYPVRTVSLPPFSIAKYLLTLGQYSKIVEWSHQNGYDIFDARRSITLNQWVSNNPQQGVGIPWYEATKLCNAISEMEGRIPCYYTPSGDVLKTGIYEEPQVKWKVNGYRLPTLAETEYAFSAGTHFDHFWEGGYKKIRDYGYVHFEILKKYGNVEIALPVGQKKPNPFGIYDIYTKGNWCWDWHGPLDGTETLHPKGVKKAKGVAYARNILQGYWPPWKFVSGCNIWGIGPIWGELAWENMRFNYGGPAVMSGGIRMVISSERGDENTKLPILRDPQKNLPKPVKLNNITEKIDMVTIPSGKIQLGSSFLSGTSTLIRQSFAESPEHIVHISSFQMAKYETTIAQWNKIYKWAIKNGYEFDNTGNKGKASSNDMRHPVVNISWYDVIKWCNSASELNGLIPCYYMDNTFEIPYKKGNMENPIVNWNANGYRIPTEAEWEYAAVGEEDTPFFWGSYPDTKYAWFGGWYGDSPSDYPILQDYAATRMGKGLGTPQEQPNPIWASHPVGQKIGNRYGLYDTYGNVWEMCWDWVAPYNMTIDQTINPKGPTTKEVVKLYMNDILPKIILYSKQKYSKKCIGLRALRGVGFNMGHVGYNQNPTLSVRAGVKQTEIDEVCGFRVVKSIKK